MAVVPAAPLTNWLPGAGIAAVTTTAGSHYTIPKAAVQSYVGGGTDITDDIRDFLFSVLSKCADSYAATPVSPDTRITNVIVSRTTTGGTVAGAGTATFSITLRGLTLTQPTALLPGTYT